MKHKHIRMFSTLLLMLPVIGQGVAVSAQGVTDETSMSTKLKTETTAIESKVLSPLGESSKEDTNELEKGTSKESLPKEDPTLRSMAESENMTSPTTSISTITIETSSTEEKVKIKGSDTSKEGDVASGTYGTAPWRLDGEGTLHISAGAFNEDAVPWKNHAEIIKKIVFEGTVIAYEDSNGLFSDLPQVTEINGLDKLDVSSVTSMENMFRKDTNLTTLDVSKWDTSKVRNMDYMFQEASSLTTVDVSGWNTTNVEEMIAMFNRASSLTTVDVSKWDTSSLRQANGMFQEASSLTTLDASKWDTSKVITMYNMFYKASSLTTLDISGWSVAQVVSMTAMFLEAYKLRSITLGPQFRIATNAELVSPEKNDSYTGKWKYESDLEGHAPETPLSLTAKELMSTYDGTKPGTYV
ncbi:BspA family leucine-rich repeat surface protein, partial [Enterococcus faecalis]